MMCPTQNERDLGKSKDIIIITQQDLSFQLLSQRERDQIIKRECRVRGRKATGTTDMNVRW